MYLHSAGTLKGILIKRIVKYQQLNDQFKWLNLPCTPDHLAYKEELQHLQCVQEGNCRLITHLLWLETRWAKSKTLDKQTNFPVAYLKESVKNFKRYAIKHVLSYYIISSRETTKVMKKFFSDDEGNQPVLPIATLTVKLISP